MRLSICANGIITTPCDNLNYHTMEINHSMMSEIAKLQSEYKLCFFISRNFFSPEDYSDFCYRVKDALKSSTIVNYEIYLSEPDTEFVLNEDLTISPRNKSRSSRMLIGLGDSWTYGIGADNHEESNWVTRLSKRIGADCLNFAIPGGSNKAAAENFEIMHSKTALSTYDEVVVVFGLTTIFRSGVTADSVYMKASAGDTFGINSDRILSEAYLGTEWSDDLLAVTETWLAIKRAENLCKANGYKFIAIPLWASDFNLLLSCNVKAFSSSCDITKIYTAGRATLAERVLLTEDLLPESEHPTAKGYNVVAKEIHRILLLEGLL